LSGYEVHVIRAVLFDLWGTLIVEDPAAGEARGQERTRMAFEALRSLGHEYDPIEIEGAFLAAGTEHERVHAAERDLSARGRTVLYMQCLDEALPDRLTDDGWRLLDEAILTPAIKHRPTMMLGAVDALKDLKALGMPVGLISNTGATPGYVLRKILDDFGLLQHMDNTVFSDEVELAKPAPGIFEGALEEFGLEPAEAVFVGDQPVLDVLGARRAGLWMVQLGGRATAEAEPHARIQHLSELLPALRDLRLIS
jgi:putative hydrolase of the HAD superfamily